MKEKIFILVGIYDPKGKFGYQGRNYWIKSWCGWIRWYLKADLREIYAWDIEPSLKRWLS